MKQITAIILVVAMALCAHANPFMGILTSGTGGSTPPSYLIEENFETGAVPSSWSGSGTIDYNFTPAGQGSLSAELDGTSSSPFLDHPTLGAAIGEVYGHFMCYFTAFTASTSRELIRFANGTTQAEASEIRVTSTGGLLIVVGTSATAETVSKMSLNTWYHVYFYSRLATGVGNNDGEGWITFTTSGAIPTSGGAYAANATMNGVLTWNRARLTAQLNSGIFPIWAVDRFILDDVPITADP